MIALEERMATAIARVDPRSRRAAGAPYRGGCREPDPGGGVLAGQEGRPSGAAVAAAQAQRQPLHRGHARAVRPHRPGPHRPFLSRRRADRRTGEHQPDRHRRVAGNRRALSRQLRLGVHVPDDAAHHPVPRGAFAARVRAARRHRLRPRRLAARRVPSWHGAGVGHRDAACSISTRRGRASRSPRCIRARPRRASAPAPASTTTSRRRARDARPHRAELALLRGPVCDEMLETYPDFCARVWQRRASDERAA